MKANLLCLMIFFFSLQAIADTGIKILNPGEAYGQLVFLSKQDVLDQSDKYKSLSPLSIPVFEELPNTLSYVAGTLTTVEQGLNSHVQLKARARKTLNLDISQLTDGMNNAIFQSLAIDGTWVHLRAIQAAEGADSGTITMTTSNKKAAEDFYKQKQQSMAPVELHSDLEESNNKIFTMDELSHLDFVRVGSKAANYAELAKALNDTRIVVRPSLAVPFYFYQQFLDENKNLNDAIKRTARDPKMRRLVDTQYRRARLAQIQDMIENDEVTLISQNLIEAVLEKLDSFQDDSGKKIRLKFRSSTNAEDLPNFNGAGLYTSKSYKPVKKNGNERKTNKKKKRIENALRIVWASIWNLRAWDERAVFNIPHLDVKMAVQINPSFSDEEVDGVVITKNIANEPYLQGSGVYIEAQRGDKHSVANPEPGVKPERILVLYNDSEPLNKSQYQIHILGKSNIANDGKTILSEGVNTDALFDDGEIIELVFQSLKAQAHFNPIFASDDENVALDIEFKVDDLDTGTRQVYLKQARPYIE